MVVSRASSSVVCRRSSAVVGHRCRRCHRRRQCRRGRRRRRSTRSWSRGQLHHLHRHPGPNRHTSYNVFGLPKSIPIPNRFRLVWHNSTSLHCLTSAGETRQGMCMLHCYGCGLQTSKNAPRTQDYLCCRTARCIRVPQHKQKKVQ